MIVGLRNLQKEYVRTLIFCGLTLVLNALVISFSFYFRGDEAISLLGFGSLGGLPVSTG